MNFRPKPFCGVMTETSAVQEASTAPAMTRAWEDRCPGACPGTRTRRAGTAEEGAQRPQPAPAAGKAPGEAVILRRTPVSGTRLPTQEGCGGGVWVCVCHAWPWEKPDEQSVRGPVSPRRGCCGALGDTADISIRLEYLRQSPLPGRGDSRTRDGVFPYSLRAPLRRHSARKAPQSSASVAVRGCFRLPWRSTETAPVKPNTVYGRVLYGLCPAA